MNWKWILKGHSGFLLGLFMCGTVLLIAGPLTQSQVMTAIGGALVGGSIGSLIAEIDGQEFQIKTLSIIQSTLDTKFVSDENRIKRFRKKWHVYYQTKAEGKYEWRYVIWDLQEQKALGRLSGTEVTYDQEGNPFEYHLEGGLRDHRIVMFDKAIDSDEACGVTVMPFMGESFHTVHYGLGFHKTWDGSDSVSPVIVCPTPLDQIKELGPVKDHVKIDILIKLWKSKFRKLNEVLPNDC